MKMSHKSWMRVFGVKFLLCVFAGVCFFNAASKAAEPSASSRKSTNVTVDSSKLEPLSIDEKTQPKNKRPTFYADQNSSVDINENGEPNLNMRF